MRLALMGRTQWLYDAASLLRRDGHEIVLIATAKAAPEYARTENDLAAIAAEIGCRFHAGNDLSLVRDSIEGLDLGISVNWVSLIDQRIIDCFRLGILNAHLGDLPRYRGNACPNWAILRGESQVGLTVHLMRGDAIDCGRIIVRDTFALQDDSSIADVYSWANAAIPNRLAEAVAILERDSDFSLGEALADAPESFRCHARIPEDGFIDWREPAERIHALVRASGPPFAGAYCYVQENGALRRLYVLHTRRYRGVWRDLASPGHVVGFEAKDGSCLAACGDIPLRLTLCRYADEKEPFHPADRWRGARMRLGVRAEDFAWQLACQLAETDGAS